MDVFVWHEQACTAHGWSRREALTVVGHLGVSKRKESVRSQQNGGETDPASQFPELFNTSTQEHLGEPTDLEANSWLFCKILWDHFSKFRTVSPKYTLLISGLLDLNQNMVIKWPWCSHGQYFWKHSYMYKGFYYALFHNTCNPVKRRWEKILSGICFGHLATGAMAPRSASGVHGKDFVQSENDLCTALVQNSLYQCFLTIFCVSSQSVTSRGLRKVHPLRS